jgi:hypothetical protein
MNADLVSRVRSWVVGAASGDGGSRVESKLLMDQRTMLCSLAALDRMRSPCHATQSTISE